MTAVITSEVLLAVQLIIGPRAEAGSLGGAEQPPPQPSSWGQAETERDEDRSGEGEASPPAFGGWGGGPGRKSAARGIRRAAANVASRFAARAAF